jgi:WD40 repeat protein
MSKSSLKIAEFSAKDPVLSMARAMSFAPDGSLVTVARHIEKKSPTYFVRWDVNKGRILQTAQRSDGDFPSVLRFAPDDSVFVTDQARGTLYEFRDAKTFEVTMRVRCSNMTMFLGIDFSPDGEQFIASSMDGKTRVWPARQKGKVKELENSYHFVGFNAAGELFGADKEVDSINPKTGAARRRAKIPAPGGYTPNHTLFDDRTVLVSAPSRRGGRMTLTDTATWKTRFISMGKQTDSRELVISPDNRLAACGYDNGKVMVWNLVTGKKVANFVTSRKCLSCLAFSRDGQWLAGCNFYKIFVVKLGDV